MRAIFLALSLLVVGNKLSAQNIKMLEFPLKDSVISHSLYNKITVLDSRLDTTNFGFVQTGAFNRRATVLTQKPIGALLSDYLSSVIDSTAQNGQLLLHLRQYQLSEITGSMSERGYCAFEAVLYAQNGGSYRKLASVDSLYTIKSGMDVTVKLLKQSADFAKTFINTSLLSTPVETDSYSYNDILNFDEIYKKKLKVFTTDAYVDGIYNTYRSFMQQTPDKAIKVDDKNTVYPGAVRQVEADGKAVKIKGQHVYAFVYLGKPYITTGEGFYELKKENTDLVFTGQVRTNYTTGQIIAASMFGLVGALAMPANYATYQIKLNPVSGKFIKVREIKESTPVAAY